MAYEILCDRRLIKLADDRFILMLQSADSDNRTIINNRAVLDKKWKAFCFEGEDISFTRGELEYQVFKYIASVMNKDGTMNVAKGKGQFFESPNELRRFFTTGMKYYASIEEYAQAGNKLGVTFAEDNGDMVVFEIGNEQELAERLKQFKEKNNVGVCFLNRNLNAMHLNYGNLSFEQEQVDHWYAVTTEVDGRKLYYKRKSSKRLLFTDDLNAAKVFTQSDDAQNCIADFPALCDDVEFSIEEQNVPGFALRRVYKKETEME